MDPELMTLSQGQMSGIHPEELTRIEQQAAASNLSKGHEVSPEDETTADVLRDANAKEAGDLNGPGQIVEEANRSMPSSSNLRSSSSEYSVAQPVKVSECCQHANDSDNKTPRSDAECLQSLRDNPEAIRLFQNYVLSGDLDSLAAVGTGGMSAEMVKTTIDMISNIEPEELHEMLEVASSFNEKGPMLDTIGDVSRLGLKFPEIMPEMFKKGSAGDSKMTPEVFQNMLGMASLLNMNGSFSPRATTNSSTQISKISSESSGVTGSSAMGSPNAGESNCGDLLSNSIMDLSSSSVPTSTTDLQVLSSDAENVQVLDPRDQNYKEVGNLEDVMPDLSNAHGVSPQDEVIAGALRDANSILKREGGDLNAPRQIVEKLDRSIPSDCNRSSSAEYSVSQPVEAGESSRYANKSNLKIGTSNVEFLQSLGGDPEAIGLSQNPFLNADPDSLPALGTGGISAEIIKTATDMISNMEAEELQKMLEVAFSLNVKGPILNTIGNGSRSGFGFPEMTPEMVKMASDRVTKMTPEEIHKMLEVDPLSNMNVIFSPRPTSNSSTQRSKIGSELSRASGSSAMGSLNAGGINYIGLFPNSNIDRCSCSTPTSTGDLQENMRHSMEDPDMQQMFTSMMKNISPEMMTNTREEQGLEHSMGEVNKAQQAMSPLSDDDLDRMMQLEESEIADVGGETVEKTPTPNPYMGRRTLILAICMLILAFIIREHRFISG